MDWFLWILYHVTNYINDIIVFLEDKNDDYSYSIGSLMYGRLYLK